MIATGDIVVVKFPFTSLEQTKQRPAFVLATVGYSKKLALLTVAMITSKIDGPRIGGDCELTRWKESGLLHPSILRLAKIATIERELITKKLGQLHREDFPRVKSAWKNLYSSW